MENDSKFKGRPYEIDLSIFPSPPDSMVKYMYQIKFAIMFKTILTMLGYKSIHKFGQGSRLVMPVWTNLSCIEILQFFVEGVAEEANN